MGDNKVFCSKFKEELPALTSAPFKGELGEKILANVSERAWRMWSEDMMIKVINEYRLNLADQNDYAKLLTQLSLFLGLSDEDGKVLEVGDPNRQ